MVSDEIPFVSKKLEEERDTDSVVITEAPTRAVSSGVLTVTVGGSTDDKKRVFIIWGI